MRRIVSVTSCAVLFCAQTLAQVVPPDPLAELLSIRESITQRLVVYRVDVDVLEQAYLQGDTQQIISLLHFTPKELVDLNSRLAAAAQRLPLPAHFTTPCCSHGAGAVHAAFVHIRQHVASLNSNITPDVGGNTCQYAPLTAALALCTLAGPIWYWPCAYVAYCSFCTGPYAQWACAQASS